MAVNDKKDNLKTEIEVMLNKIYDTSSVPTSDSTPVLFSTNINVDEIRQRSVINSQKSTWEHITQSVIKDSNASPELKIELAEYEEKIQGLFDQQLEQCVLMGVLDQQCDKEKHIIPDKQSEAKEHLLAIQAKLHKTEIQLEEAKQEYPEDAVYHEALEHRIKDLVQMESETHNIIKHFEEIAVEREELHLSIQGSKREIEFCTIIPDFSKDPEGFRDTLALRSRIMEEMLQESGEFLDKIKGACKSIASSFSSVCSSLSKSVSKLMDMDEIKPSPSLDISPS